MGTKGEQRPMAKVIGRTTAECECFRSRDCLEYIGERLQLVTAGVHELHSSHRSLHQVGCNTVDVCIERMDGDLLKVNTRDRKNTSSAQGREKKAPVVGGC